MLPHTLEAFATDLLLLAWSWDHCIADVLSINLLRVDIIGNVTLEELLFELQYNGVEAEFICANCRNSTRLKIVQLHPLSYKS